MSFYVKRSNPETGRNGWTGSIRSERQAHREADAWRSCGWTAEVVPNTLEVRREVRSWQQLAHERRIREQSAA